MIGYFLDRTTELVAVNWKQDPAGGSVPTPGNVTVSVPCCVQQDSAPRRSGKEASRQASISELAIFFGPSYSAMPDAALAAVKALKQKDRLVLDDGRTVVLDGPAFDRSGRGEVFETACEYTT